MILIWLYVECRSPWNLQTWWMGKPFGSFGCFGWTQGQCCHVCQRFPHDFKSWRVRYTLEQDIWFSHWDLDQSLILFHHAMTWNTGGITGSCCMSMYVVWWSLLLTIGDCEWFWILRYHAHFFPRIAKKCQLYSPNLVSWVRKLQHVLCFTCLSMFIVVAGFVVAVIIVTLAVIVISTTMFNCSCYLHHYVTMYIILPFWSLFLSFLFLHIHIVCIPTELRQ